MRATIAIFALCILLSAANADAFSLFGSSAQTVTAKDGVIRLDTSGLGTQQAKHYQYKEGKTIIRFFLVRDNQGAVRAALDACEACWRADKGYKLQDGVMLCVNCGMKFALRAIGEVRGGCNPHPIVSALEGNTFKVSTQELLSGAKYFPGNAR